MIVMEEKYESPEGKNAVFPDDFMAKFYEDHKRYLSSLPLHRRVLKRLWPLPWKYRLIHKVKYRAQERTGAYSLKCLYQRAVNGYGETDHWNGDSYIARVIAGIAAQLAKDDFGAPTIIYNCNGKVLSEILHEIESEETRAANNAHFLIWNDILLEISEAYSHYDDMIGGFDKIVDGKKVYCGYDSPEVKNLQEKFKRASGLFHRNFSNLWN
jgi:hypothetical protein